MNGYELSRKWFDFCFENPEKIKPNHSALYFFIVENCNRLGWKEKFGLPTTMAKDAIGIKNYKTYINTLNDLVEWNFVIMVEKSKNQYSSNIVALVNFTKAHGKALDKAILKHGTKQPQSIASIDKPITINKDIPAYLDFLKYAVTKKPKLNPDTLKLKYDSWIENNWKDGNDNPIKNWKTKILNTLPYIDETSKRVNTNPVVNTIFTDGE